jgi:hypothetical protein
MDMSFSMSPETKPETTKATPPIETGAATPDPTQTTQQPRKGRGRPFGSRSKIPPLEEVKVSPDGEPPQDSAQPRKRRAKSVDIEQLAKQLKGIHELASNLLPIKMPDGKMLLALSDTEATQLANAISGVAKEYDLALDGKTGAAIQLFAAVAMIYGPRVYVIQKIRMAQRSQVQPNPGVDSSIVAEQNVNGHATAN